ncbi:hypothetical protein V8E36_004633, partial [Tilletia maclaganii]
MVCDAGPLLASRKVEQHRESATHMRKLGRAVHELSSTSVRRQRFKQEQQMRQDQQAQQPPLSPEPQAPWQPPPLPRSQFERDWDGMFRHEDAPWDFGGMDDNEQRILDDVRPRIEASARRVDEDRSFWPWPDRATFLLHLVVFAPRTPFSRMVTELCIAFANAVQHYDIPTYNAFREAAEKVRQRNPCQTSIQTTGSAGNLFFYNRIKGGIARVRKETSEKVNG